MGHILLRSQYTMLFTLLVLASQTGISVTGQACVHDTVVSDGVDIKWKCFKSYNQCVKLADKFPKLYNITELPVMEPTTPRMTSSCIPDQIAMAPQVEIEWKLEQRDGAEKTRGFELVFDSTYPSDYRCVIITFVTNITKALLKKSQPTFVATFFPIHLEAKWAFPRVYSLPRSDYRLAEPQGNTSIQKCDRPLPANQWCPQNMTSLYDVVNKTLTIEFDGPPRHININQYDLIEDTIDMTGTIINQTSHTYLAVEPGNYSFHIIPYDPYEYLPGKCVCLDETEKCNLCKYCKGPQYDVHIPMPPREIHVQEILPATDGSTIIAISVVCFIFTCFIITAGVWWAYRRHRLPVCFRKFGTGRYQRLVFILETNENVQEIKTVKTLTKQGLHRECNLSIIPFDTSVKSKLAIHINRLVDNTGNGLNTQSNVCVCLPLTGAQRDTLTKDFLGLINYLNLTFAAKTKTVGMVLDWDNKAYEMGVNREVHIFHMPEETKAFQDKLVPFMKAEGNLEGFTAGNGDDDYDTIDDCRSELLSDEQRGRKRYVSNDDSGLGESLPMSSYLKHGSHMYIDIDSRGESQDEPVFNMDSSCEMLALVEAPDVKVSKWVGQTSFNNGTRSNKAAHYLYRPKACGMQAWNTVPEGSDRSFAAPSLSEFSVNSVRMDDIMDELVALNHRNERLKDLDVVTYCSGKV